MKAGFRSSPILPRASLAGPTLGAVTMVMSFLACLALGAAVLVGLSSDRWLSRATSAMTVQILDAPPLTAEDQQAAVMRELDQFPGVVAARILDREDMIDLLEPWLGVGNVTEDLPLPVLIEITPDDRLKANSDALAVSLKAVAPGAHLDTHGRWRETLTQTANVLKFLAGGVLIMVAFATITVLIFATRAGLLANAEILEVLHQIGAYDRFIARHFEVHFIRLTFISALIGGLLAGSVFALLGTLVPDAHNPVFFALLLPIPFGFAILSWIVTRHYVLRSLAQQV